MHLNRNQIVAQLRAQYQANDTAEAQHGAEGKRIDAEWSRIDAELELHGIELCEIED